MPDVQEVFRLSTKKVKPDPGALDRQHTRQRRQSVGKKVGAFAVAAAIGLVAVVLILANRVGEDAITPALESPTVEPTDATPQFVATRFIQAYGTFDVEQALTHLAEDADISGLVTSMGARGMLGTPDELRPLVSLLEAQGYEQLLYSCQETGSSESGTSVRCTFDYTLLRSDEVGLGPYSGSYFDLTVRDDGIVAASQHWGVDEFSPQMWEPFASWVSGAYPEDAAVMYEDETYSGARLTEESIRLWDQRTREYAAIAAAELVEIAERFMEARSAYDAETALSLVADGVLTAPLLHDNLMNPEMGAERLNQQEIALAFEVERLYEVRYEPYHCRVGETGAGPANVICTVSLDSKLRRLAGYTPVESEFRLGIQDGRIVLVTFPWLNISWSPGGYFPKEFEPFVLWMDAEHPESIDAEHPGQGQRLFQTKGQEWIHKLDRDSIDLLATYLDEYERSAPARATGL